MSLKVTYRHLCSLLSCVLFASCNIGCESLMRDNLDHCAFYVRFSYHYNMSRTDLFSQQVEKVYVYIFDQQGQYVSTMEGTSPISDQNDYQLMLPRSLKGNTVVVWAGRITDSYTLPTMEVGDRIEKLTLQYKPTNNLSQVKIADLWHSGPEVLNFRERDNTTQTISLVRNTNTINVQVLLADHSMAVVPDHAIKISTANGSYDHQNNFLTENPSIDYTPYAIAPNATASIQTIRMVEGQPMMLSIRNLSTGQPMKIAGQDQLDLTKYFAMQTPSEMTVQEYFDRCYGWDLKVNYQAENNTVISIVINGWTVWLNGTDLQ